MAIIGIDEVGRGPWAGPLVMGAVVLPEKRPEWVAELNDSKKCSKAKRRRLNEVILAETRAYGLGWVWEHEIDEMGMPEALRKATRRAIQDMQQNFSGVRFSEIVIDGLDNFLEGTALEGMVTTLAKGDALIKEVSAASIIAKVARDDYMARKAGEFPEYDFENNVGYGTPKHIRALEEYGVTPIHRFNIKRVQRITGAEMSARERRDEVKRKNTSKIGQRAEEVAARFLEEKGQEILYRNYKNQICEIDIVSRNREKIYFNEVRYRKKDTHGSGIESITLKKLRQMKFAARVFLANRPEYSDLDPLLTVIEVAGENFGVQRYETLDREYDFRV